RQGSSSGREPVFSFCGKGTNQNLSLRIADNTSIEGDIWQSLFSFGLVSLPAGVSFKFSLDLDERIRRSWIRPLTYIRLLDKSIASTTTRYWRHRELGSDPEFTSPGGSARGNCAQGNWVTRSGSSDSTTCRECRHRISGE